VRRRPRALPVRALCAAATIVLAACDASGAAGTPPTTSSPLSSSARACAQASDPLVRAVQRYVDRYASAAGTTPGTAPAEPPTQGVQSALKSAEQSLRRNGCNLDEFRAALQSGLAGVATRGPVARAVLLRLSASLEGTARTSPATITVRPGDDLPGRLAELAAGSTVRLAAGTYPLSTSLPILAGVTLVGAGEDRTTLVSAAGDAGLLVLTDDRVELRALAVRHTGRATGDLVVGNPTSALVLTRVRVSGARGAKQSGGNGVLMTAGTEAAAKHGTTLQVTSATFDHNTAAGIMLSGGHVASIRQAAFEANGTCGVCFAGTSSGAVRASTFANNHVGAAALDNARPTLTRDTFRGGLVGVQASGHATPVVQDGRIDGATRAAMIFTEHAGGTVDGITCTKVPFGIVVSPEALPLLGDNSCTLAHGR
jgi:hypothetical protein